MRWFCTQLHHEMVCACKRLLLLHDRCCSLKYAASVTKQMLTCRSEIAQCLEAESLHALYKKNDCMYSHDCMYSVHSLPDFFFDAAAGE